MAQPAPTPSLPYCGLGDVGCNGKTPSCECLPFLFACGATGGTCSPLTVGTAVVVVGLLVVLWLCCSKQDDYDEIRDMDMERGRGGKTKGKKDKSKSKKDKKGKKSKTKVAYIDDRR